MHSKYDWSSEDVLKNTIESIQACLNLYQTNGYYIYDLAFLTIKRECVPQVIKIQAINTFKKLNFHTNVVYGSQIKYASTFSYKIVDK